jgi:hypothetical protein
VTQLYSVDMEITELITVNKIILLVFPINIQPIIDVYAENHSKPITIRREQNAEAL